MTDRQTTRCVKCGARLAPSAQWCSLCLTPVAVTEPASAPSALSQLPPPTTPPVIPDAADVSSAPRREPAAPSREGTPLPEQRDGSATDADRVSGVNADAMLAELAATEGHRRGTLSAAMSSRRNRYVLAAVATAVFLGCFLLATLVLMRFSG